MDGNGICRVAKGSPPCELERSVTSSLPQIRVSDHPFAPGIREQRDPACGRLASPMSSRLIADVYSPRTLHIVCLSLNTRTAELKGAPRPNRHLNRRFLRHCTRAASLTSEKKRKAEEEEEEEEPEGKKPMPCP